MARAFLACAIALASLAVAPAHATVATGNVYGGPETIVALLDSGVRPTHQEFDWGGPDSTTDQFVGWWDFTNADASPVTPAIGQTWDPRNPIPYDDHGHGTATASLAVGRNIAPPDKKAPSFAPGTRFAEGKVCTSAGTCNLLLVAAGIRWAVDTIHADVISISIGAVAPLPDAISTVHEAAQYAREAGTLVVVAGGNGIEDTGLVPNPAGWATPLSDSTAVLAVGASDMIWQPLQTYDPEVTARYDTVPMASNKCDACYSAASGTSLGTPLVAGIAAAAVKTAVANGVSVAPDFIETLLKYCARDTAAPPQIEGYGALDEQQMSCVTTNAAAGTLPARPNPDLNAVWVDQVDAALRDAWTNTLDQGSKMFVAVPAVSPTSGAGSLGDGAPAGLSEGERYQVTTAPRGITTIHMHYTDIINRNALANIYVFSSSGPNFSGTDLVAVSDLTGGNNADAEVSFRSPSGGEYTVLIACRTGYDAPELSFATPFTLTATSGTEPAELSFAGESYYLTTTNLLFP